MTKKDLSELSVEQLQDKLKVATTAFTTIACIFGVIIVAWIVLGYWRTNVLVFISTIAVAIAAISTVSVAPRSIQAELERRKQE